MDLNEPVKKILSCYESDNPGTKANLARILLHGKLGGNGSIIGRNTFQRSKKEALDMLGKIVKIYQARD